MTAAGGSGKIDFAQDIMPMFREKGRRSMRAFFDLFQHADVAEHADAILGALSSGKMPCDGAWPTAKVQRWIDAGEPA